ncbi:hypothetical protein MRX96_010614 [Rhipicephalus microplus]
MSQSALHMQTPKTPADFSYGEFSRSGPSHAAMKCRNERRHSTVSGTHLNGSPPSLIAYGFLLDDELLPYFLSEARRIYGQVGGNGLRKVRWWSSVPGHHVGKMFN